MAKEISSLRIVQAVFRFILWVAGVKLTVIGEENVPTDTPVLRTVYFPTASSYKIICYTSVCPIAKDQKAVRACTVSR